MTLQPVMVVPEESVLLAQVDDQPLPAEELASDAAAPGAEKPAILVELVIEEVSIDGMCGVY